MATSTKDQQTAKRRIDFWSGIAGDSRNLGSAVRYPSQSGYVIVGILLMIFVCLLLPLMAFMYFDILKVLKQAEQTEVRLEKKLKNLEEKEKDDSNSRIPPR